MQSFSRRLSAVLLLLQVIVATAAEEVKHEPYGSFSNDPGSKLSRVSPEVKKLSEYLLYTKENRKDYSQLDDSNKELLRDSPYKPGAKTFLIIHGWTGNPTDTWVTDMKNALLDKEPDANVIAVGWKKAAAGWTKYGRAAANTRLVGPEVAKFLKFLSDQDDKNTPDKFHVIGFSLGAQVAGFAGKSFYDQTKGMKIGRITGLDPARPEFQGQGIDRRLDATDADFVDVIHTDTVSKVFPCGTSEKSGTFDFWPNGGKVQPGCGKLPVKCSHYRAHQYFIESIKSSECFFRSYRSQTWDDFKRGVLVECGISGKNCPEMGYSATKYKGLENGNFYLSTNSTAPYCIPSSHYVYVTFTTGTTKKGQGGMDPRVVIYGSQGNSGTINFKGTIKEGTEEKFLAQIKNDIGELSRIKVSQAGLFSPKWNLRRVTLRYVDNAESYYACFDGKVGEKALVHGDAECQKKHLNRRPLRKDRNFRSRSKKKTLWSRTSE